MPARRNRQPETIDDADFIKSSKDSKLRLGEDLAKAAREITAGQARYLVDAYYQVQQFRIEATGQKKAATDAGEPVKLLDWLRSIMVRLEGTIREQLDEYTDQQAVSRWAKSLRGIGPVITAGLSAHIDITKAATAGAIWRFAGLDPTTKWLGKDGAKEVVSAHWDRTRSAEENAIAIATILGRKTEGILRDATTDAQGAARAASRDTVTKAFAKRPWNASLKTLCWKIGESFVKVQRFDDDVYGKVYAERKVLEVARNERGDNAATAARILTEKNFGDDTLAKGKLLLGRLPDAQIHERAKRYAVKLFLAHYHHVAYESHFHRLPPKPYIIEHGGHTHFIAPPNWPMA